jgi:IS5 family transposase
VLQSLYNLSDEQTELMIRDRLSFMRFLDLGLEDPVPDATAPPIARCLAMVA